MANLKKLYCLGRRKETLKNSIFHGPEKTSVSHTLGDMFSKKREPCGDFSFKGLYVSIIIARLLTCASGVDMLYT